MGRVFRLTVVYIASNSCWTKNTQLLDDFFIPMIGFMDRNLFFFLRLHRTISQVNYQ